MKDQIIKAMTEAMEVSRLALLVEGMQEAACAVNESCASLRALADQIPSAAFDRACQRQAPSTHPEAHRDHDGATTPAQTVCQPAGSDTARLSLELDRSLDVSFEVTVRVTNGLGKVEIEGHHELAHAAIRRAKRKAS